MHPAGWKIASKHMLIMEEKLAQVFRLPSIIRQRVLAHNQLLYYFVPKV